MALRDIVGALRDEEFWRDIARNTRAMGELGIEFGEGAVGEVAGGITGLGKLATGSSFKEAGETMENVQDWAGSFYEPKYQETEDYMQSIGGAVQPLVEKFDTGATWLEDKTGGWIPRELTKGSALAALELSPLKFAPTKVPNALRRYNPNTNIGQTVPPKDVLGYTPDNLNFDYGDMPFDMAAPVATTGGSSAISNFYNPTPSDDLVVAIKYEGGISKGKKGDLHFAAMDDSKGEIIEQGFVDADGNFYNRDEALEYAKQSLPNVEGMENYSPRAHGLDAKDLNTGRGFDEFGNPISGSSAISNFIEKNVPLVTGLNVVPDSPRLSDALRTKNFSNEVKSLKGEPVKKVNEVRQKIKPNPYVAYHSTSTDFNEFDPDMGYGGQMWFTSKRDLAEQGYEGAQSGRLVEAELDIRNPAGRVEYEKYGIDELMGMGYDGIKLVEGDEIVSVAFFPEQVRMRSNAAVDPDGTNLGAIANELRTPITGLNIKPKDSALSPNLSKNSELPKLRIDNPKGDWLERKIKNAKEAYKRKGSIQDRIGASDITAYFKGNVTLPTKMLKDIKGAMGEEKFRHKGTKLENIKEKIKKEGYTQEPIHVVVREDGEPFILEGNHRLAEALKSNRENIDVQLEYYRGAEEVDGILSPKKLKEIYSP